MVDVTRGTIVTLPRGFQMSPLSGALSVPAGAVLYAPQVAIPGTTSLITEAHTPPYRSVTQMWGRCSKNICSMPILRATAWLWNYTHDMPWSVHPVAEAWAKFVSSNSPKSIAGLPMVSLKVLNSAMLQR